MITPPRLRAGDQVAVLSLSGGLPELFPHPFELGLRRLRDVFGLVPVEYPTTRVLRSSHADRARDLHAAWADPEIKGVISTIGGEDQIKLLRHLDPELLRTNPKLFMGYSDNVNLLNYLFTLGVSGVHGGSVMVELGRGGALDPLTEASWRAALFEGGEFELTPARGFTDISRDWAEPAHLETEPDLLPGEGWTWDNADTVVEGRLWGGCLEILGWNLGVGAHLLDDYSGHVLFLETSEERPSATEVYRTLMLMGERGLLGQFAGVLVGRPRAGDLHSRVPEYVVEQRVAVRRALAEYAPGVPVVHNLDIGHTDPQQLLPYGGQVRIDGPARRVTVRY
ncbi:S66 peptidase family protein [Longispora sp. NPDC051575]|uniref:S66 family peptidase n=1 Tax=Longispora sp. NPDC051575 TaxID=3154943 RepID=UPI003442F541